MTPAWAAVQLEVTPRGFTGHEHVDEMGLIHMNGRIYDALLGRFLQADPFVEDATTLNRYTYVHNNPLAYTDPSGYFSLKKAFRTIVSIAISVIAAKVTLGFGFTFKGFLSAVLGGAASGAVAAGSVEGALWGAFAGGVFFGIGQQFAGTAGDGGVFGTSYTGPELAKASVAHGIAGGTIAELQGGKFGHGFLSAGVAKAATPAAMSVSKDVFVQGAAVAIVGGTTSRISGGKFANGAVTAAMGFAFNQCATEGCGRVDESTEREGGVSSFFRGSRSFLAISGSRKALIARSA
nr:RHS repeat-associated core domain-containing protein [Wenzhouxiangella sp. XN79A]